MVKSPPHKRKRTLPTIKWMNSRKESERIRLWLTFTTGSFKLVKNQVESEMQLKITPSASLRNYDH